MIQRLKGSVGKKWLGLLAMATGVLLLGTLAVPDAAQAAVYVNPSSQYCSTNGSAYGLPWQVYANNKASRTNTQSYLAGKFCMMSNNGKYKLTFDTGGVLRVRQGTKVIWSRGTASKYGGDELRTQWDGNVVIYDYKLKAQWAPMTNNKTAPYHELYLTDAGKFQVYQLDSKYRHVKLLWTS